MAEKLGSPAALRHLGLARLLALARRFGHVAADLDRTGRLVGGDDGAGPETMCVDLQRSRRRAVAEQPLALPSMTGKIISVSSSSSPASSSCG